VANIKDKRTLLNYKPFNIINPDSLNFCKKKKKKKRRETGFTPTKIRAIETAFTLGVEPKLRERFMKQKRSEDAIRNLPQKVFETKYFLTTVRAFMVLTQ
jgi:pseudouridine-5'-phosphate glycosidase